MPDLTDSSGSLASPDPGSRPAGHQDPAADALTSMALMQSPLSIIIFDPSLRITWINDATERVFGGPASRWAGRPLSQMIPGLDTATVERSLRRVLETGEMQGDLEIASREPGDPASERFWACIQSRIMRPDGTVAGITQTLREVTERHRNQQRLALADQASARIGSTLDITRTAEELLDVAIGGLADAGAVDLLSNVLTGDRPVRAAPEDRLHLLRVAVRWPEGRGPGTGYLQHTWAQTSPARRYHQSLLSGTPVFLPDFGQMTPDELREIDSATGFNRMIAAQRAGGHSMMIVPLAARGVIMGIMVLYRVGESRPFIPADLALAQDLAGRAAVWVDNARHYTRERAAALELQRGMLPRRIPAIRGLDLAYRYVPAGAAAEVGGDWFDVIPLAGDRCALIVGDVTGHDMRAASLMGQLRTATHTLAMLDLTPAEILRRLDRLAIDLTGDETSATCAYVVRDPDGGCAVALAGHPVPAVARPGCAVAFPDLLPGTPLGLGVGPPGSYQAGSVHVPPGSTMLLYTDGLIERPGADLDDGMRRLAGTLTGTAGQPVEEACDALLAELAPNPADDVVILMART